MARPAAQPGCRQKWTHLSQRTATTNSGNRITQITQEVAKEVLLMAQSLRRRECISVLDLQWVMGRWGTPGEKESQLRPHGSQDSQAAPRKRGRAMLRAVGHKALLDAIFSIWGYRRAPLISLFPPPVGSLLRHCLGSSGKIICQELQLSKVKDSFISQRMN